METAKFDPRHSQTDRHQNLPGITTIRQTFIQMSSGFSFLHMRDFAHWLDCFVSFLSGGRLPKNWSNRP